MCEKYKIFVHIPPGAVEKTHRDLFNSDQGIGENSNDIRDVVNSLNYNGNLILRHGWEIIHCCMSMWLLIHALISILL